MNNENKKFGNSKQKNLKSPNDKFGFADSQTLIKEKLRISNDIIRVKKTNINLQKAVNKAQNEYDQNQLLEIDYLYRYKNNYLHADSKYKTMTFPKQINHLENELSEMSKYNANLNKYFSEEALSNIKTEVCFEKHIIAQQKEELKMLKEIYEKNKNLFNSKKYKATVDKFNKQKKELSDKKKELKAITNEEQNLNILLQESEKLPKIIQKEENEIIELKKRLDNLIHAKTTKTRDLNNLKKKIETENSEMEKKIKTRKKSPLKKTEKKFSYVNPRLSSRRIIVSQPSSGRSFSNTNDQSPKTKRLQNEAIVKPSNENDSSSRESNDSSDSEKPTYKRSSSESSSDYEKEVDSDSYRNKSPRTEKALSTNLSHSSSSSTHDTDSDRSSEAENFTEPHSGKHTSSEDSDQSANSEDKDKNEEGKNKSDEDKDTSESDSDTSEDDKDKSEDDNDKEERGELFKKAISDADHEQESYSEGSLDDNDEKQTLLEHDDTNEDSSGSFKD